MRRIHCSPSVTIAVMLALLGAASEGSAGAQTVYDLTTDWSDSANPNGPWAYRQGADLLPHVAAWQGLSGDFTTAQPAWARFDVGTSNLPCFFRSSATVGIAHDWLAGDVVCHTTDGFNGLGSGAANVTWTSPVTGVVAVTGAIWMGRDIGRSNHWSLSRNGTLLTGGDIASGDPYSRAAPMSFASGSGGAGAIAGIAVNAGDVLELDLTKTSTPGDYAVVQWQVHLLQPSGVDPSPGGRALRLALASPNPVRGGCALRWELPSAGDATLQVYDVRGRLVATLARGQFGPGDHASTWSAAAPAGLYFVRLAFAGRTEVVRIAVLD